MEKVIETPRPYLTWSQMNTLEASEKQYIEIYFENKPIPENEYMRLGKELAERLKIGLPTDNQMLEHIALWLPKNEKREYKIEASLSLDNLGEIPLLGIIDGCKKDLSEIREIKTGTSWTQGKVDKHGQLDFYALLVYLKVGKIPKIFLDWVETAKTNGVLEMTGKIETFERKIDLGNLLIFTARIKQAWFRIKKLAMERQFSL